MSSKPHPLLPRNNPVTEGELLPAVLTGNRLEKLATLRSDLPGILAVAATYVYFLLFAQFAFLSLLHERLAATPEVERAMAAMGITGFLVSLATAWLLVGQRPRRLLTVGFAGCAATAMGSLLATGIWALATAAAAIGAATAVLTVALATGLRELIRGRRFGLAVGLGTGSAYLLCNLPPIFEGSPALRTTVAAAACLVGLAAVRWQGRHEPPESSSQPAPSRPAPSRPAPSRPAPSRPAPSRPALSRQDYVGLGFVSLILSFLALIWLDSAAFAIIQETVALKGSTWGSASQKLILGASHFLAAALGGWLIDRGFFRSLLIAAFSLFGVAFTLLDVDGFLFLSGPIYAVGISLYSVALVAYPAYRQDGPGLVPRRWRAGIIYGVAGWLGSALGVGMAQNLHYIPRPFLWTTGALLVAGWALARNGRLVAAARAHGVTLACGTAGVVLYAFLPATAATPAGPETAGSETVAAARGRRVYIQEGCINCHSQYVRPRSRDVELWGPHRPAAAGENPPLYGNRRQGPDLTNAGSRRPREWHRLHLIEPRTVSAGSRMPSYAHLFADGDPRGDDLVAYLASLRAEAREEPEGAVAELAAGIGLKQGGS